MFGPFRAKSSDSLMVHTSGMRSTQLLSSYRAGRRLNVCSRTLRRYVRLGILGGRFERGQWRFPAAEVEFLRTYGPPHQCGTAAAKLLGIGVRKLRRLTRQGVIPAHKAMSGYIYARADLLSLRDEIGRSRRGRGRSKDSSLPRIRSYRLPWGDDDAGGP
jgi:Helix-turn-helix domain